MTHTTTDAAEVRALKVQEIDRIATLLLNEWKRVDPSSGVALHPASYIANFADMARVVIADRTTIAEASEARAREVLISQICADSPTLFPNGVREAVEKDMAAVMLRPSRVIAAMLAFATAEAASGAGTETALRQKFRDASRGYGRAGTAEMTDGPYMSMDDAAAVYASLASTNGGAS